MIKIRRERPEYVASISLSMFIIKCIFFIYLFSVNIYSYPMGNERHKAVNIYDLIYNHGCVTLFKISYEDFFIIILGEMECNP